MPGGRIALTRRHTYLGVPSSSDPAPSLLPAFEPLRNTSATPGPSTTTAKPLGAGISKLQSWLDDDDSDEEDQPVKSKNGKSEEKGAGRSTGDKKEDDEEMEIRVGGKTVKVLRKRQIEETEEEMASLPALSPKGKGKQRAVECLCGEVVSTEESSHGTVSCTLCETSFHLACLNVNSRRHLPLEWACQRCSASSTSPKDTLETPPKRLRTELETTPPMSAEPTFVTTTFSPLPRGNFSSCPDVALAPSPTSSPKRSFTAVPTSPVLSASKVAIPATPQFGKESDPRSDYSPCSPLFSRKSRSRLTSGVFDSAPFANDWAADPSTNAQGGGGGVYDEAMGTHTPFADHSGNDWVHHPGTNSHWHDITMTPSRASNSAIGWETPFSRSRQSSALHPNTLGNPHLRTPSQDIFSGSALDYVQQGRHTAPAQMFAQRLFGASNNNNNSNDDHSSPSRKRTQPLQPIHRRNPSSNYILPSHAFSSPGASGTGSIFSQFPPTPNSAHSHSSHHSLKPAYGNQLFPVSPSRQAQSSAMKASMSAPGMIRNGSNGLGIGYESESNQNNSSFDGEFPIFSRFSCLARSDVSTSPCRSSHLGRSHLFVHRHSHGLIRT